MQESPHSIPLQAQSEQLKAYADMVRLYPDNEAYLRQYAEMLIRDNQLTLATEILRHLHQLLIKQREPRKADMLGEQYPQIGRIRIQKDNRETTLASLLPSSMQGKIWQRLHQRHAKQGECIAAQDDQADTFYLIQHGEVTAFLQNESGGNIMLNQYQVGEIIGNEALIQNNTYTVSYIANKPSTLIKLHRKNMLKAMTGQPVLSKALQLQALMHKKMTLLSCTPLFEQLPVAIRRHIASESCLQQHNKGHQLHQAGSALEGVDLIINGSVSLVLPGNAKPAIIIHPISLATVPLRSECNNAPADFFCLEAVELLHIPNNSLTRAMQAYPPLQRAMLKLASQQQQIIANHLND